MKDQPKSSDQIHDRLSVYVGRAPLPKTKAGRNEYWKVRAAYLNGWGVAFAALGLIPALLKGLQTVYGAPFSEPIITDPISLLPVVMVAALAVVISLRFHQFALRATANIED